MPETTTHIKQYPFNYRIRIMATIIIAELCMLLLVLFWPVNHETSHEVSFSKDDEVTELQAPMITRQQSSPPPPPSPQVPIPVPTDEPIPPRDIKFPQDLASNSVDSLSVTPGQGGEGKDAVSGNPEVAARVQRIDEPTFENKSPGKADIYVKFLIDKKGTVEDATIEQIFLYDDHGNPTKAVSHLDDYIEKQTLKAALNWKFRPARENGHPVRSYSVQVFTVDY